MNLYEGIKNNLTESVITKDDLTADVKRDLNIEPGSDEEYELDNLYDLRDIDEWIEDLYDDGESREEIKNKFAIEDIALHYGMSEEELDSKVDEVCNKMDNSWDEHEKFMQSLRDKKEADELPKNWMRHHEYWKDEKSFKKLDDLLNDRARNLPKGDIGSKEHKAWEDAQEDIIYARQRWERSKNSLDESEDIYGFASKSNVTDFIADGRFTYGQKIRFIADELEESGNVDSYSDESHNDYLLNVAKILHKAADDIDALK